MPAANSAIHFSDQNGISGTMGVKPYFLFGDGLRLQVKSGISRQDGFIVDFSDGFNIVECSFSESE
jgi:hypothetical protein